MHYNAQAPKKKHLMQACKRLTLTAMDEREEAFLCWLFKQSNIGGLMKLWDPKEAEAFDDTLLKGFTDDELWTARHVLVAIYEGEPPDIAFKAAMSLQEKGLLKDVEKLPGRGRYAGRFEFHHTDKLEQVVMAFERRNKRRNQRARGGT